MKINKSVFAAFIGAVAVVQGVLAASSTPQGWTDNLDEALARAKTNGRLVLVDFSGSDWCGWCVRLDKEVFSQPEFLSGATNKYELVLIDSPQDESLLSERAKAENPKLCEKFGIRGFPTVLLLDADGNVLLKTGYRKGGPVKYLKFLKSELKKAPQREAWVKPIEEGVNAAIGSIMRRLNDEIDEHRKAAEGKTLTREEMDKIAAPFLAEALPALEAILAAEQAKELPQKGILKSIRKEREKSLKTLSNMVAEFKRIVAQYPAEHETPAAPPAGESATVENVTPGE